MFLPLGVGNITIKYFPYFKNSEQGHHGFLGLILLFTFIGAMFVGLVLIMLKSTFVAFYSKDSSLFIHYFNLVLPIAISISIGALFSTKCFSDSAYSLKVLYVRSFLFASTDIRANTASNRHRLLPNFIFIFKL